MATFGKQHPACMYPTWNTMHLVVFLYAFELICTDHMFDICILRYSHLILQPSIKSIYLYITGKIIEINVHFIHTIT